MPNWCNTAYTLVGEENELKALYDIMNGLEKRRMPSVPNGFGNSWLGCLVDAFGYDWQKVCCRGEWSELSYIKGTITFYTMTAWCPCNEVWELIRKKYPSIKYYFTAEESDNCFYLTNDVDGIYYPDRYVVELCTIDEDYCTEFFQGFKEACSYIEAMTGHKVNSQEDIEQLDEEMKMANEEAYCYLHEYKVVE